MRTVMKQNPLLHLDRALGRVQLDDLRLKPGRKMTFPLGLVEQ
jgi:hypothetical protein